MKSMLLHNSFQELRGWAFCLILLGGKIGYIISTFDRI